MGHCCLLRLGPASIVCSGTVQSLLTAGVDAVGFDGALSPPASVFDGDEVAGDDVAGDEDDDELLVPRESVL
jgi:hypothetical protein